MWRQDAKSVDMSIQKINFPPTRGLVQKQDSVDCPFKFVPSMIILVPDQQIKYILNLNHGKQWPSAGTHFFEGMWLMRLNDWSLNVLTGTFFSSFTTIVRDLSQLLGIIGSSASAYFQMFCDTVIVPLICKRLSSSDLSGPGLVNCLRTRHSACKAVTHVSHCSVPAANIY